MVLHAYAPDLRASRAPWRELNALLHQGDALAHAQRQLVELFHDLIERAARAGSVRTDVSTNVLAVYCVHALTAASLMPSKAAVGRLVEVTAAGLRASSERA